MKKCNNTSVDRGRLIQCVGCRSRYLYVWVYSRVNYTTDMNLFLKRYDKLHNTTTKIFFPNLSNPIPIFWFIFLVDIFKLYFLLEIYRCAFTVCQMYLIYSHIRSIWLWLIPLHAIATKLSSDNKNIEKKKKVEC